MWLWEDYRFLPAPPLKCWNTWFTWVSHQEMSAVVPQRNANDPLNVSRRVTAVWMCSVQMLFGLKKKKKSLKWKSSQRWTESMQNCIKLKPKGMCFGHTDGIFIRLSQSVSQLLGAWNRIIKTCVCYLFFEYLYENVLSFYLQHFVMDSQMSNGYLPNVTVQHAAVQEPVCGVRMLHLNLCDSSSQKRVHFSD